MALLTKSNLKTLLASLFNDIEINEADQNTIDLIEASYNEALDNLANYGDVVEEGETFDFIGKEIPTDYADILAKNEILEQKIADIKKLYSERLESGTPIIEEPDDNETVTETVDEELLDILKGE